MLFHRTSVATSIRAVALASAAITMNVGAAWSAQPVGDAQVQARDLLSGTVGGQPKTFYHPALVPDRDGAAPILDPQEQARQLILGSPRVGGGVLLAAVVEPTEVAAPADPQEAARRMILGHAEDLATAAPAKRKVRRDMVLLK